MVTMDKVRAKPDADATPSGEAEMDIADWKLFWSDLLNRGAEMCTPCSTLEAALWTACHAPATELPLRIEGPGGEMIPETEIRQYCRDQTCR
jgi:hypothetical protein